MFYIPPKELRYSNVEIPEKHFSASRYLSHVIGSVSRWNYRNTIDHVLWYLVRTTDKGEGGSEGIKEINM